MDASSSDPYPPAGKPDLQSEDLYLYGLIGKTLTHSFSQRYFLEKFKKEEMKDHYYELFPLDDIDDIRLLLEVHKNLMGLNVTVPYKETVIPYLDELDPQAAAIGAVNCIVIDQFEKKGFNTDWLGFRDSLLPHLKPHHDKAIILGNGGSAKAVAYALRQLQIPYQIISRQAGEGILTYSQLNDSIIESHKLIIQTTPLGMWPEINAMPEIPVSGIGKLHICFDLIYNPSETLFLKSSRERGATTINGQKMLELQARYAWKIWSNNEAED